MLSAGRFWNRRKVLSLKTTIKLINGGMLRYEFIPSEDRHRVSYVNGCWQHMWTLSETKPAAIINHIGPYRDKSPEVGELCRWLASQAKGPWHE